MFSSPFVTTARCLSTVSIRFSIRGATRRKPSPKTLRFVKTLLFALCQKPTSISQPAKTEPPALSSDGIYSGHRYL